MHMKSFKLPFIISVVIIIFSCRIALCQDIELNKKVDSLIQIALDEDNKKGIRRNAIYDIYKMNNSKGLQFLIKKIELEILKDFVMGDDAFEDTPCFFILYDQPSRNWNLIPIIIEEIENEKTNIQLEYYSIVLKRHFEKDLIITIVEYYKTKSKGIQSENIDKLLAILIKE